jgi:hypothetical protein
MFLSHQDRTGLNIRNYVGGGGSGIYVTVSRKEGSNKRIEVRVFCHYPKPD